MTKRTPRLWSRRDTRTEEREANWKDRGASALEWAIIAAVTVLMVSIIGGVINTVVSDKSRQLKECADKSVGSACTDK